MKRLTLNPGVNTILQDDAIIAGVAINSDEQLQLEAARLSVAVDFLKMVFTDADIDYVLIEERNMQAYKQHYVCLINLAIFEVEKYGELDEFQLVGEI